MNPPPLTEDERMAEWIRSVQALRDETAAEIVKRQHYLQGIDFALSVLRGEKKAK